MSTYNGIETQNENAIETRQKKLLQWWLVHPAVMIISAYISTYNGIETQNELTQNLSKNRIYSEGPKPKLKPSSQTCLIHFTKFWIQRQSSRFYEEL